MSDTQAQRQKFTEIGGLGFRVDRATAPCSPFRVDGSP